MKKLAICGDSWFSSDTRYPKLSFGEIIAERKKWELVSLARGGCSNFAIALQIDKAIELGAELILIGATSPDRIELPLKLKDQSTWDKLKSNWSFQGWIYSQPNLYRPSDGLSNVLYKGPDLSCLHGFLKSPTMMSESINNILFLGENVLDADQMLALKYYVLNLYDSEIKKQYDSWIISNACRKIIDKNIPFLLSYRELLPKEFDWLPHSYDLDKWVESFRIHNHDPNCDHLFHYNAEHGEKIADYLEKRLIELKK
jgi:hypothetical protein